MLKRTFSNLYKSLPKYFYSTAAITEYYKQFPIQPSYPPNSIVKLDHRALLRIKGPNADKFLQGLISNDIRLLQNDHTLQANLMMNAKGRVLFDVLISFETPESYLIEC